MNIKETDAYQWVDNTLSSQEELKVIQVGMKATAHAWRITEVFSFKWGSLLGTCYLVAEFVAF